MHSERRLVAACAALMLAACAVPGERAAPQAGIPDPAAQVRQAIEEHKQKAFTYCQTQREIQCREQFQAILKLDPSFTLSAAEEKQPQWAPIWSSLKGASEDDKAIARGSAVAASKGQEQLAEGMRIYKDGRFREAATMLEQARATGLADPADQVRALKYIAFSYCLTGQATACRKSFAAIFKLDPAFTLLPSEAGHPSWRNIFRKAQAAAKAPKKR